LEKSLIRQAIHSEKAPAAIGSYSQAIQFGSVLYLSGQIGLDPQTMQLVEGIEAEIIQVFRNLQAVAAAGGGRLEDAVKVNLFLLDMNDFALVNRLMPQFFHTPFPARATVAVAALPRGAHFEADAIVALGPL
jgi:reactive intermediate/imine deaminase